MLVTIYICDNSPDFYGLDNVDLQNNYAIELKTMSHEATQWRCIASCKEDFLV